MEQAYHESKLRLIGLRGVVERRNRDKARGYNTVEVAGKGYKRLCWLFRAVSLLFGIATPKNQQHFAPYDQKVQQKQLIVSEIRRYLYFNTGDMS